ncbi:MAG: glutamine synthetase type III, partial [Desulfovibrio sp.]|nr:glutamine synthetase type III [Desulfovibrio sp.]
KNARFLLFLAAFLKGVDDYQELLRSTVSTAGNDHRLGANEAPPAIISVYLGEQLADVLRDLTGLAAPDAPAAHGGFMEIGVSTLPPLPRDCSDRNRTSPFAFTGNKFEFRAVGSSQSIAPVNIALNSAVACALDDIATELEAGVAAGRSLNDALQDLLPRVFRENIAVVFNGNGYSDEWPEEAKRRGLPNCADTVEALRHYSDAEVMGTFLRPGVLNEREILARQEILLETYAKTRLIEGNVLSDMLRTSILPHAMRAVAEAADQAKACAAMLGSAQDTPELERYETLRGLCIELQEGVKALDDARAGVLKESDAIHAARAARSGLVEAMARCRRAADALEGMTDGWPLPRYAELLWLHA